MTWIKECLIQQEQVLGSPGITSFRLCCPLTRQ
jgi:hypothetical protein